VNDGGDVRDGRTVDLENDVGDVEGATVATDGRSVRQPLRLLSCIGYYRIDVGRPDCAGWRVERVERGLNKCGYAPVFAQPGPAQTEEAVHSGGTADLVRAPGNPGPNTVHSQSRDNLTR
jgi:hypothetical protein